MPAKLSDIPSPKMTVVTMNAKPAIASGRLRMRYQRSFLARRVNGSRSNRSTACPNGSRPA